MVFNKNYTNRSTVNKKNIVFCLGFQGFEMYLIMLRVATIAKRKIDRPTIIRFGHLKSHLMAVRGDSTSLL